MKSGIKRKVFISVIAAFAVVLTVVAGFFVYTTNSTLDVIQRDDLLPDANVAAPTSTPSYTDSIEIAETDTPKTVEPSVPDSNTVTESTASSDSSGTASQKPQKATSKATSSAEAPSLSNVKKDFKKGEIPVISSKYVKVPKQYKSLVDDGDKSLTVLLLGSDSRGADQGRSDTIMVAHIPEDRDKMYLISFPRDMYVKVPGHGSTKINHAYQYGGAKLTASVVQSLLGVKIDHIAIIDFNGFIDLVDTLGGVTINNPYAGYDKYNNLRWEKGVQTINRDKALHYVRWRHGLPDGDVTRTQNQQRVISAIVDKILSRGTLSNPKKVLDLIGETAKNFTIDRSLTNSRIVSLALQSRIGGSSDIIPITAPILGFTHNHAGAIDAVDTRKLTVLAESLQSDSMDQYHLATKR